MDTKVTKSFFWARIKPGATISHDFGYFRWPNCHPPNSEFKEEPWSTTTKYPNRVFFIEITSLKSIYAISQGYGVLERNYDNSECSKVFSAVSNERNYGNGCIRLYSIDELEEVEFPKNKDDHYLKQWALGLPTTTQLEMF